MKKARLLAAVAVLTLTGPACADAASGPSDAEIAHIAYTAGAIDVAAGKQALAKSTNAAVRSFAAMMVRDHDAVNGQALALVKKLNVTPAPNGTSTALSSAAEATLKRLGTLDGAAFDRAYVDNEIAFPDRQRRARDPADPGGGQCRTQGVAGDRLVTVPRAPGARGAGSGDSQISRCARDYSWR